jgi:hypothetical protein
MLKQAVAYYHELLNDFDLAESSRQALDEGLESARLIFGGRNGGGLEQNERDLRNCLERAAKGQRRGNRKQ